MTDNYYYWNEINSVCKFLNKNNATTSENADEHIHIGASILGSDLDAWRIFLKLYSSYESVLFSFGYGDKAKPRQKLNKYAAPVADIYHTFMYRIDSMQNVFDLRHITRRHTKYFALNFSNADYKELDNNNNKEKNTIEFRNPNSTINPIIWQNYINAYTKLLLVSKYKDIDEDFLDYKLKNEFISYYNNKYIYGSVNIKLALEFIDLIFDNNLDKIYFLKQYLNNS